MSWKMDGFVKLIWENDEIVSRRPRPSTFMLSQRGSSTGRNDSSSHSQGRTLYQKRAKISIYNNNNNNYSTVNHGHDHQTSTPTRNVFELFSSATQQQRQLASTGHDDDDDDRNRPLLLNLIKTSTTTATTSPHDHHQQPKTVKRPPPADDHAMYLVPDDHDHDPDDRQMPILDQDHQNYYACNHSQNHEAAVVPSFNSVGASNDHHLPSALYSVEQEPQTLSKRVTRPKRDAPTTKLHNLSERRRRDKINKKMRALQALIPNCNKVDKASILDDAIAYLKTLQLQLQMMSMGSGLINLMHPMMLANNGALVPHLSYFSPMPPPPITSRLGVQMFGIPSFMPWHVDPSSQVARFQTPLTYSTHNN